MSISLNSISKFKVRVLPTILDFIQLKNELPSKLVFSMACLIQLYIDERFSLKDNEEYLAFFEAIKHDSADQIVEKTLSNTAFWDQDLNKVPGLKSRLILHYEALASEQMADTILSLK